MEEELELVELESEELELESEELELEPEVLEELESESELEEVVLEWCFCGLLARAEPARRAVVKKRAEVNFIYIFPVDMGLSIPLL